MMEILSSSFKREVQLFALKAALLGSAVQLVGVHQFDKNIAQAAYEAATSDSDNDDNHSYYSESLPDPSIVWASQSQTAESISNSVTSIGGPDFAPSATTQSMLDAQIPKILALRPQYEEAEARTGVPWFALAAMDYRENGNNPSKSACAGEGLGQECVDQGFVIGDNKLETLIWTAEHSKEYYFKITGRTFDSSNGITIEDLTVLLTGHARGTAPGLPSLENKIDFSYNSAFMNENLDFMKWENNSTINPDDRTRGRSMENLGAMTIILGLAQYELL